MLHHGIYHSCIIVFTQVWLDRNQWRGLLMLVDANGEPYFPHMLQLPLPVLQQILGLSVDAQQRCVCCVYACAVSRCVCYVCVCYIEVCLGVCVCVCVCVCVPCV